MHSRVPRKICDVDEGSQETRVLLGPRKTEHRQGKICLRENFQDKRQPSVPTSCVRRVNTHESDSLNNLKLTFGLFTKTSRTGAVDDELARSGLSFVIDDSDYCLSETRA